MNKNQFIVVLITTLIVGWITVIAVQSNPVRPEKLPTGVSLIEVKGHEYIQLQTPTGSSLTHSESCPNDGGE